VSGVQVFRGIGERTRLLLVVLACSFSIFSFHAYGQDCPLLEEWWAYGPTDAVVSIDDLAFLKSGDTIQIVDISDPSSPEVVNSFRLMDLEKTAGVPGCDCEFSLRDLAAIGQSLVVLCESGVQIVDVEFPEAPRLVASYCLEGWAKRIWVFGDYAYIDRIGMGLVILDLSEATNPRLVSEKPYGASDIDGDADSVVVLSMGGEAV